MGCYRRRVCFPHPESEREQLQQHLHSEESSEHHVEDVHDVAELFGLFVVLQETEPEPSDTPGSGTHTEPGRGAEPQTPVRLSLT